MAQSILDRPDSRDHLVRITTDQYHRMLAAGVLKDGDPVELVDGVLVYKDRRARGEGGMTIGKRHAVAVQLLLGLGPALEARGRQIRTQQPLTLPPHDEPEADGVVVRGRARDYLERHPGPADASCVIEVAESSLELDRTAKLAAYASARIPQYLIVNLVDGEIEVYEDPRPAEGRYARARSLGRGDTAMLDLGEGSSLDVAVAELLP